MLDGDAYRVTPEESPFPLEAKTRSTYMVFST